MYNTEYLGGDRSIISRFSIIDFPTALAVDPAIPDIRWDSSVPLECAASGLKEALLAMTHL
jgi:hypothetical protein